MRIYLVMKNWKPDTSFRTEAQAKEYAAELHKGWNMAQIFPIELQPEPTDPDHYSCGCNRGACICDFA